MIIITITRLIVDYFTDQSVDFDYSAFAFS